ncbi:DUF1642 domain-containing protein [Enterococcus faecium]|uniref:DUF1642 domain-containing protein n=1 Tax=Enterococcus faecium TaxID=1352 RepID=UPI0028901828|nr:DUF1642 domain-containing protein [Enterococcus faecium]MDT2272100.1 DUF1642 domain-containing protein [Enterococcus faecium]
MNKQELIDELKRISLEKQHKALTHPESKNYYEGMVMAYSQVVHMVNTVLKLDEPKKPVVPQFVAEWIEKLRKQIVPYHFESGARFMMFIGRDFHHKKGLILINEEIRQWLEKDGNEVILSDAIDYGYEVEKESLYRVVINNRYLAKMSNFSDVIILVSENEISECATESYELTEKQIKAIDERYWPFAVPVVEVTK